MNYWRHNPTPAGWYRIVKHYYKQERLQENIAGLTRGDRSQLLDDALEHYQASFYDPEQADELAAYWFPAYIEDGLHGRILARIASLVEKSQVAGCGRISRILDAGCGVGLDACFLAKRFPQVEVYATDYSSKMIELSEKRATRLGVNIHAQVAAHETLPDIFPGSYFDLIIFNGSFLYSAGCQCDDPDCEAANSDGGCLEITHDLNRLVTDGGHFILLMPAKPHPYLKEMLYKSGFLKAEEELLMEHKRKAHYWRGIPTKATSFVDEGPVLSYLHFTRFDYRCPGSKLIPYRPR